MPSVFILVGSLSGDCAQVASLKSTHYTTRELTVFSPERETRPGREVGGNGGLQGGERFESWGEEPGVDRQHSKLLCMRVNKQWHLHSGILWC